MKTAVCVLLLSILPCVAWAEGLSKHKPLTMEDGNRLSELDVLLLIKNRVVEPCIRIASEFGGYHTNISKNVLMKSIASDQTIKQIQDVPFNQRDALLKEMMERCAVKLIRETLATTTKKSVGLKRHILPVYPGIAKKENWEGTVVLRVAVQPNGRPEVPITVQWSSGHQVLDDAAIAAVTRWTFHPEKDGNIPIRSIVEIPIKFSLTGHE